VDSFSFMRTTYTDGAAAANPAASRGRLGVAGGGGGVANARSPPLRWGAAGCGVQRWVGGDVLSHRVAPAVPSAQRGLTSEFGMGSGVSPAL
jgi:hypothetical protein